MLEHRVRAFGADLGIAKQLRAPIEHRTEDHEQPAGGATGRPEPSEQRDREERTDEQFRQAGGGGEVRGVDAAARHEPRQRPVFCQQGVAIADQGIWWNVIAGHTLHINAIMMM